MYRYIYFIDFIIYSFIYSCTYLFYLYTLFLYLFISFFVYLLYLHFLYIYIYLYLIVMKTSFAHKRQNVDSSIGYWIMNWKECGRKLARRLTWLRVRHFAENFVRRGSWFRSPDLLNKNQKCCTNIYNYLIRFVRS